MNPEALQTNWAIWLALAAIFIGVAALTPKLLRMTSRSKLNRVVIDLKTARKELRKAVGKTQKAEKKARKLHARAERVKPRILREAKEAFEDAQALEKILQDKVMVAENHVRRVIHDEYPPDVHERMRETYLAQDDKDKRPFSF